MYGNIFSADLAVFRFQIFKFMEMTIVYKEEKCMKIFLYGNHKG